MSLQKIKEMNEEIFQAQILQYRSLEATETLLTFSLNNKILVVVDNHLQLHLISTRQVPCDFILRLQMTSVDCSGWVDSWSWCCWTHSFSWPWLTISWPSPDHWSQCCYVEHVEWPEAESEVWCHNASVNIFCWPEEGQGTVTTLFTDHNVSVVVSGGHLPVQPGLTVINMPTALTSTAILCSCVLILDMDRCVAVIDYIREYQEKNLHIRKFVKFKIKC